MIDHIAARNATASLLIGGFAGDIAISFW